MCKNCGLQCPKCGRYVAHIDGEYDIVFCRRCEYYLDLENIDDEYDDDSEDDSGDISP